MSGFAELRRMMVDCQLRTYDVTDRRVLAAADAVAREAFVPAELSHFAYLDQSVALPGTDRALPAPMLTARMIQFLEIQPGESALEYAGGTGYGAALMAEAGAKASFHDPQAEIRAQARADLAKAGQPLVEVLDSLPATALFDAILVSGACEVPPETLFRNVRPGGRLIVVEGVGRSARVMLYYNAGGVLSARPVFDAAAPVLREFRKAEEFVF